MTAETIAILLAAYFGIGLCFALAFVSLLLPRQTSLGCRFLALPGATLLWPLLALKL